MKTETKRHRNLRAIRPESEELSTPRNHHDKTNTSERKREIALGKLMEAFQFEEHDDLYTMTADDYWTVVKPRLNWAESTYRMILKHLGIDPGDLREGMRTYMPTPDDIETLKAVVDSDMITTMMLVGCRFTELWSMVISGNTLVVYSQKGSNKLMLNIEGLDLPSKRAVQQWVSVGSHKLSWSAARKRWARAAERGLVDRRCVPHTFRHRKATLMEEAGYSIDDMKAEMGWKKDQTVRRYTHANRLRTLAPKLLGK